MIVRFFPEKVLIPVHKSLLKLFDIFSFSKLTSCTNAADGTKKHLANLCMVLVSLSISAAMLLASTMSRYSGSASTGPKTTNLSYPYLVQNSIGLTVGLHNEQVLRISLYGA
jgi:hypothetical protein